MPDHGGGALTKISFAALLAAALERFPPPAQDPVPLEPAKKWLRAWLDHVDQQWRADYAKLVQRSDAFEDTVDPERLDSQLEAIMSLLRSAFSGNLTAVTKPAQRVATRRRSDETRDWPREKGWLRLPGGAGGGEVRSKSTPIADPVVSLDIVIQQLQGACQAADRLLAAAQPPPARKVPLEWGQDREILDLLEVLMQCRAMGDGAAALKHIEAIANNLAKHGIDVVDYTPERETWFTVKPSSDPAATAVTTGTPALTFRGELARMGEVFAAGNAAAPGSAGDQDPPDDRPATNQAEGEQR